jgi:glutamine synthetase
MIIEYIWLDVNQNLRSKTRVIYKNLSENDNEDPEAINVPIWEFDGSSTGQATTNNSVVLLKPVALYQDPFRGAKDCILALCETYNTDGEPHSTNTRCKANEIFTKHKDSGPLFGLEQEFFVMKDENVLAFSNNKTPDAQGDYYCSLDSHNITEIMNLVLKRAMATKIMVSGFNAEVAPSQWEIQLLGEGISSADNLIIVRYILNKTFRQQGYWINYEPKPLTEGDWNGSGCHVNFSTTATREANGYTVIKNYISRLEEKHSEHVSQFGNNNNLRLTGTNETSSYENFTSGVGDRTASVRIPVSTEKENRGYLEDRRPASNMDPYLVTSLILETCLE